MASTTRLSKVLSGLLIATFAVQWFIPDTVDYLALVPGRTLPCVWNLATAPLVHVNPVELAVNVAALLVLARLVEPAYGSKEFLKFMLLVDVLTCLVVFVFVYIAFAATSSGKLLYTKFCGFHGITAALLVALKQVMPAHELRLLGTLRLKIKYLPSVVLVAATVLAFALGRQDHLAFYLPGTYLSWVYLRFFQPQPDTGHLGDASEEFKFSSFFPPPLAPGVDAVSAIAGYVTRLRHSAADTPKTTVSLLPLTGPSALGADAADASRRRERGAKALEERLGKKVGSTPGGAVQTCAMEAGLETDGASGTKP